MFDETAASHDGKGTAPVRCGNGILAMNEDIHEQAVRWHVAQDREDMDWPGFTLWLEESAANRAAYDDIAMLDARIADSAPLLADLTRENSADKSVPRHPWRGVAAMCAAAVVMAVGVGVAVRERPSAIPQPVTYSANARAARTVQIADAGAAVLEPGSSLTATGRGVPMTLSGAASFDIRHDPANPIVIRAGGYEIRDVGTQFHVMSGNGMLRVQVSEGEVAVRADGVAGEVNVAAGKTLTAGGTDMTIALAGAAGGRPVTHTASGRIYTDLPLGLVAADLSRYSDAPIVVDPAVSSRRFSGVIADGSARGMADTLAGLTGLHAVDEGNHVRLSAGR